MKHYVSIEKSIEIFELYKSLWKRLGVNGVRTETITEGLIKAIEIEKSNADMLYFIVIVADGFDYLPYLKILSGETNAPILIAASTNNDEEHHQALILGADFYGKYCDTPEQNIKAVIASINSIERRANKKGKRSHIVFFGDILLSRDVHQCFILDKEVHLTKSEMEILHYLIINQGLTITFELLSQKLGTADHDLSPENIYNSIKRLRDKIRKASDKVHIENIRDVGYRLVQNKLN